MAFGFGVGFVHHAFGHDVHFALGKMNGLVLHFDVHRAFDDDEHLVGVLVIVPNELAFEFGQLELIVVHLCNHSGAPMVIEGGQFLCQVDGGHKRLRPPALLWFISQSNGTLVIAFDYEGRFSYAVR